MFEGLFFAIILIITLFMKMFFKKIKVGVLLLTYLFFPSHLIADNHNIYETIEQLQKDIKTLERAVYSGSTILNSVPLNAFPTVPGLFLSLCGDSKSGKLTEAPGDVSVVP